MRKGKVLGLAVLIMGLLSGCEKFEPEETAISVDNKGQVVSYVKESFDKDYYSSEELEASIDQAILDYNTAGGTENVKKKKFEVKDQNAELTMSYATGNDYSKFNNVTLFTGDVLEAYQAGYDFAGKFQSVEKGQVTATDVTGNDILNSYNYGIVILTEPILVTVPEISFMPAIMWRSQERKLQEFFQKRRLPARQKSRRPRPTARSLFPQSTAARRKKLKEVQPHWLTFYMNKGD